MRSAVVCDSFLLHAVAPPELAALEPLLAEVEFAELRHKGGAVPRRVAVQCERTTEEPVYRHPVDWEPAQTAFTPRVDALRRAAEAALGATFNHALIQHYRGGADFISEHADKTLDVSRGSVIANLSLGAARTLVLRLKKGSSGPAEKGPRPAVRVLLPHNSLFVLGPETNRTMTHEIRKDGRPEALKSPEERACDGHRVSITLRSIATFRDLKTGRLTGQGVGALHSGEEETPAAQVARLLAAFRDENRNPEFDWDRSYGRGFSVLATSLEPQPDPAASAESQDREDPRLSQADFASDDTDCPGRQAALAAAHCLEEAPR